MSSSGFCSEFMPWDVKVDVLQEALDYTTQHPQRTRVVRKMILDDLREVLPQLEYEEEEIEPPVEENLNDEKHDRCEDEYGNVVACERPEEPLISRSFEVEEEDDDENVSKEELENKEIENAENTTNENEGSYFPVRANNIVDENRTIMTRAQKKRLLETRRDLDQSVKKGEAAPKKLKGE